MELAMAALSSLLPKLTSLLMQEYNLQKRVKGEIKFLIEEMVRMQVALTDLSNLPADLISGNDKIWARDLKELSYDIEDDIDKIKVRVDGPAEPSSLKGFRRFIDKMGFVKRVQTRHQVAEDIAEIKVRVHDVAARRHRYKLQNVTIQPDSTANDPRLWAINTDVKELVGIGGPAEELIKLLALGKSVQKQQLMVVSIVGVGGLGKTTLAKSLYERVREEFQCQAFVPVSFKPDMNEILKMILRQVSGQKAAKDQSPSELVNKIKQILETRRYIIVFDDVWEQSAWGCIKCALVDNNLGSRVIVTTRHANVAKFACSSSDTVYELEPLSDTDSKRLFCERVFNKGDKIPSDLEDPSKKILRKCGGVPLAIITIASMLASTPDKTKYEWYRVYSSMGRGLHQNDKNQERMRRILSLSYHCLPSHLKPCLLYLSLFPEDFYIPRDMIVQMWVAEGFIAENLGRDVYELGEMYFNELANRSMIQPIDMDENGRAGACCVHDMILDLIVSISIQENFVTVPEGLLHMPPSCKIRRLLSPGSNKEDMDDSDEEESSQEKMVLPALDMSHVRSLIDFDNAFDWSTTPMSTFSVLRVLVMKYFPSWKNDPKHLGTLLHLRYLKLDSVLEAEHLEAIGNLRFLKTLDLSTVYIDELPASIIHLRQLEHLLVQMDVKLPDGIGKLRLLQELSWLNVKMSPNNLVELGNLTELRVLRISGLDKNESCMKTFLQSLSNLGNIHLLYFDGDGPYTEIFSLDCTPDRWTAPALLRSFESTSTFCQVPQWFASLSELSRLSIEVNQLKQGDIQLLGALPVLRFLKLRVAHPGGSTEEQLVIGACQPFPSLAYFEFCHYTSCCLLFTQGVMPKLRRLHVYYDAHHRKGGCFDIGLENLTSLEHVTVKVDCMDARIEEVEDAEARIRDAIDMLPRHLAFDVSREDEYFMAKDEDEDDSEDWKQQSFNLMSTGDESNSYSDSDASDKSAEKQDSEIVAIIENKLNSGGSILVPGGEYKTLKLLRFTSPHLPSLTFSEGAMPELQRIDLEVHLTMDTQADEAIREIVRGLSTAATGGSAKKLKVIIDAR